MTLERVLAVAQLTTRYERKYVLPREALASLVERLPGHLAALDLRGLRIFDYRSTYFDTPDHMLYRHHVQGRRKRYKTRIRSYFDTNDAMLEVKFKGRRGETVKMRLPYDWERRDELTCEGRAFIELVVAEAYGMNVPPLVPALSTSYQRATLVDLERGTRVTIDTDLSWSNGRRSHPADHLVCLETKSLSAPGPVDALLRSMATRPVQMSKYCLGVALLDPETAANRWSCLLRREFGWERAAAATAPTA